MLLLAPAYHIFLYSSFRSSQTWYRTPFIRKWMKMSPPHTSHPQTHPPLPQLLSIALKNNTRVSTICRRYWCALFARISKLSTLSILKTAEETKCGYVHFDLVMINAHINLFDFMITDNLFPLEFFILIFTQDLHEI